MEDLKSLHYIKEKELPAINHIFYDNSDGYRIKKRKELYNPFDKSVYNIYSSNYLNKNIKNMKYENLI